MARASGILYGGAVIARSGRRCWYIWGATDRDENLATGHILQWRALLWAKSQGCTEYDFGGYTPGATSGPAWFKEGFGGTAVHLVCAHRRVLDPKRYNFLRAISKLNSWI
jgi:lipid II:glycine glycyltransferase (peptidoglycan interpeptide bridge formation enzyme)